jgi:hypothetical protein
VGNCPLQPVPFFAEVIDSFSSKLSISSSRTRMYHHSHSVKNFQNVLVLSGALAMNAVKLSYLKDGSVSKGYKLCDHDIVIAGLPDNLEK